MSRASQLIFTLLGLMLFSALAWLVYMNIEFYEETEKSQWSSKALRNPYLAAQQFLQASDIKVSEAGSLLKLDSLDNVSTVLITNANQVVNPLQLEAVLEWLRQGGSLIVTASPFGESEDLLLDKFDVQVDWSDYDDDYSDDDDSDADEQSMSDSLREYNEKIDQGMTAEEIAQQKVIADDLTTMDFGDNIGTLEIDFDTSRVLSHPHIENENADAEVKPFSWSSSSKGIHMIQFDVGDGLLTIISDPTIWQSKRISQYDHAYLLWVLSSTYGDFALLRPTHRDSLWDMVWQNAFEFVIALALFIAGWLWFSGHRFGRVIPLATPERRALSEHFSATANYLWHRKAVGYLLQPLRQNIFRQAHLSIPAFARADADERISLIAEHCEIESSTVSQALHAEKFNEISFVRTVKLLKKIEQLL